MTLNRPSSKHAMNALHGTMVIQEANARRLDKAIRESRKEEKAIRRIAEQVKREHITKKAKEKSGSRNIYLGR